MNPFLHSWADRFACSPELAPMEILDAALGACEAALVAQGHLHFASPTSTRARSVVVAAHRLSAAIAAYREVLENRERRERRKRLRDPPF